MRVIAIKCAAVYYYHPNEITMSAHESVHKTPARHRLQVDQNQIPCRYEHPYQPSILIWY